MNALTLIQKRLQQQNKVAAYNKSIAYRGVRYVPSGPDTERHGTFTYRGRIYTK